MHPHLAAVAAVGAYAALGGRSLTVGSAVGFAAYFGTQFVGSFDQSALHDTLESRGGYAPTIEKRPPPHPEEAHTAIDAPHQGDGLTKEPTADGGKTLVYKDEKPAHAQRRRRLIPIEYKFGSAQPHYDHYQTSYDPASLPPSAQSQQWVRIGHGRDARVVPVATK